MCMISTKSPNISFTSYGGLSGCLPKSGPFIFASENQFLWNLAHQKGFVHN